MTETKPLHKGRMKLSPGYTYLVIFDNRNYSLSSSHIKYDINIETEEKKRYKQLNSRRFSQLSTGSKRTEMVLLVKEIIGQDSLQKKITIEEDRPSSQLSASLSTSEYLVPRSSCSSAGTVEVNVHVHRSKSLTGNVFQN